uniref:Uncharacterized protein n=1 Tax=Mycena chlorophos TaxID=658473 RepID=A0ABQ0M187_MYCCL|nr:predicted protein [Mycena chlorophos]
MSSHSSRRSGVIASATSSSLSSYSQKTAPSPVLPRIARSAAPTPSAEPEDPTLVISIVQRTVIVERMEPYGEKDLPVGPRVFKLSEA